jgi:hypothetical protein
MDLKAMFRKAVAPRRPKCLHVGGVPLEREDIKVDLEQVRAVRASIAEVLQARADHTVVTGQKDAAVQELRRLEEEAKGAQAKLRAREKQIALAGGEIPDEPFPEEGEVARCARRVRIGHERLHICEGKVRDVQGELDARIRAMEESWSALGAVIAARLLEDFRAAAEMLKEAQLAYSSLSTHFFRGWNGAIWKHYQKDLAVIDPMSFVPILNPRDAGLANKWPTSVQTLQKDMESLRAEIDQAKAAASE